MSPKELAGLALKAKAGLEPEPVIVFDDLEHGLSTEDAKVLDFCERHDVPCVHVHFPEPAPWKNL